MYEKILHLGILINTITTTINLKEIADQDERHLSCVCAKNITIKTDRGGIQSAATVFSASFSVLVWKAQCRIYHDCKSFIIYPQALQQLLEGCKDLLTAHSISCLIARRHNIQHNDAQYNDIQHEGLIYDTWHTRETA